MESRELRIGNYVNWIIPFSNEYSPKKVDIKILSLINNDSDICKPIPLTEEWLLKFGFKDDNVKGYFYLELNDDLYIYLNPNSMGIAIKNQYEGFSDHSSFIFFKYIHQLQNLYFALTGEELTTQELNQ
jgi:hypothetical protein